MSDDLILAGDIGGTKCNLALFRANARALEAVAEHTYPSRDFSGLETVVKQFNADTGLTTGRACFGVAGAVLGGESHLPNLGWRLSETALASALKLDTVRLINDLEANALGISTLKPEQLFCLNPGQPRADGNRALIAAGTGLGMALLIRAGDGYQVAASEGGHADFAPRNEEEVALWRSLANRFGRVSVERVVSGRGLENIYTHLKQNGMYEPDWLAARLLAADDPAASIAQAGAGGEVLICAEAVELFLSAYGAAAGNLALTGMASGGFYIGGGIAPKLLEKLKTNGFMAAFTDKGRFSEFLSRMPVRVILEPKTALYGAAVAALRLAKCA